MTVLDNRPPIRATTRRVDIDARALAEMRDHAWRFEGLAALAPLTRVDVGGKPVIMHGPGGGNTTVPIWTGTIESVEDGDNSANTPPSLTIRRQRWERNEDGPSGGDPVETRWQKESDFPFLEDSPSDEESFKAWPHPGLYPYIAAKKTAAAFDYEDADYDGRKPLSYFYKVGQVVTLAPMASFPFPVVVDFPACGTRWIWARLVNDSGGGVYTWREFIRVAGVWERTALTGTQLVEVNGLAECRIDSDPGGSPTADDGLVVRARPADNALIDLDAAGAELVFDGKSDELFPALLSAVDWNSTLKQGVYTFAEWQFADLGYGGMEVKPGGRTGTAINLPDDNNDGTGVQTSGVNEDTLPGTFTHVPIGVPCKVWLKEVKFVDGLGDPQVQYVIAGGILDSVDGECDPTTAEVTAQDIIPPQVYGA